ncbi:MAG: anhydro-N-acetylmuramic acid kinase [Pseudomonadota bacterium]
MNKDQPIWVTGCMSGTSMDGVDVALVRTDGVDIFEFAETQFAPFSADDQRALTAALGQWPGDQGVARVADIVETAHIAVLGTVPRSDLIGFHGQTLAHDPTNRRTHQAGDGARIAQALHTPVVWDFRSDDVAMGGQGAPLAPAFHHALIRWAGVQGPVVVLNLGGVGNATLVDPDRPMDQGGVVAFDTGPANAPMNDLMQKRLGKSFDANGAIAMSGQVSMPLVQAFLSHPFFSASIPKSLDRNDFEHALAPVLALETADALATLCAIVAGSVAQGLAMLPAQPLRVLVTGGGRKNPAIMAALRSCLSCCVDPIEDIGADGDMVEAQAFAYLAARVARGLPTSFPTTTGVGVPMGGGILSRPTPAD